MLDPDPDLGGDMNGEPCGSGYLYADCKNNNVRKDRYPSKSIGTHANILDM